MEVFRFILVMAGVLTLSWPARGLIVSVNNAEITEGLGARAAITFSLSEPQEEVVMATYAVLEMQGSLNWPYPAREHVDFVPTNGLVTFPVGETNQTIYVDIIDDDINEADEPFRIGIMNTSKGTPGPAATCVIHDNDPFAMWFNDVAVLEGQSGLNYAVFTFSTSRATEIYRSGKEWSFSTANGTADFSDYHATGGWWSLDAGPARTNAVFGAFAIFGDTANEDDETFFLQATGMEPGECTIINDDFFLEIERSVENQAQLTLHGALGASHVLEQSTDLVSWTAFSTNVLGPERVLNQVHAVSGNRFYRAVLDFGLTGTEASSRRIASPVTLHFDAPPEPSRHQ